jgi:Kef-type K+ transport system membrane component KefB
LRRLGAYLLLLALGVGGYWFCCAAGAGLVAPAAAPVAAGGAAAPAAPASGSLLHFLLALAVVIGAGGLLGRACKRLGQSPVIGEVLAGIALGPSLLGRLSPGLEGFLLPASVAPPLGLLAQLGVVLYMFQVGLDLDLGELRGRGSATVSISHASIVLPFVLGCGLSLWLYPRYGVAGVPFSAFALFMGVALSITAFPVLARILDDLGLSRGKLGSLALSCAAVDDVTAWCLLAVAVAAAGSGSGGLGLGMMALGLLAYLAVMLLGLRPLLLRLTAHVGGKGGLGLGTLAVVCWLVLLSAVGTEALGIHAVFGAFLLGALVPHDSALVRDFKARFKDAVAVLLLPAFFAVTGLRTQLGLLDGAGPWLACAAIVAAATLGKVGGASLAGRLSGLSGRDATALGLLMNTRGLVELIALNIGLDLGVLSPSLFTMMVVMALLTTLATVPALRWLTPGVLKAGPAR